jgi:hypothetical protein
MLSHTLTSSIFLSFTKPSPVLSYLSHPYFIILVLTLSIHFLLYFLLFMFPPITPPPQLYSSGLVTCSKSELLLKLWIISTIGRTPRTSDQPDAGALPSQDSTTQKVKDKYPCRKRDSNPRSQRSRPMPLAAPPLGAALSFLLKLFFSFPSCHNVCLLFTLFFKILHPPVLSFKYLFCTYFAITLIWNFILLFSSHFLSFVSVLHFLIFFLLIDFSSHAWVNCDVAWLAWHI